MYNFEVYTGKILPQQGFPDIGASGNIVLRMASIVPRGLDYILYFDNWFCGVDLQVVLKKVGISSVGTVREARLKGCKLPSNKVLKKKGRGSYVEMATTFEGVSLRAVKWFDNRPVTLLSTFASASPEQAVKRFDKKTRTTVSIPRPAIVGIYNDCMGGVDLLDMLVALYRIHVRSKKWPPPLLSPYTWVKVLIVASITCMLSLVLVMVVSHRALRPSTSTSEEPAVFIDPVEFVARAALDQPTDEGGDVTVAETTASAPPKTEGLRDG
nr:piggyBac transposable element-derived protein 1-like [Rhipicephalus microplus]